MMAKLKELLRLSGGEWLVSFTTRGNPEELYNRLKDEPVNVEIKKFGKHRSKDANSFCWAMCTDIGNAMKPPLPKEMVYRQAIRDVGKYSMLLMKDEAVETFQRCWNEKGVGWFAEVLVDSKKNPGCKVLMAYYGTSAYDSLEMSRVLDYLRQDMENMGLPIPLSRAEQNRIAEQWGR
ncbi:MAG: hypothetical protein J6P40_07315 [Oscillospiraceae bacterium]|nr:hypothetical protein [Oscillospiraceae bacterium]